MRRAAATRTLATRSRPSVVVSARLLSVTAANNGLRSTLGTTPTTALGIAKSSSATFRSSRFYAASSSYVFEITDDADFQTKVMEASNNVPVIVDCYADWCGPCRMLAPALKQVVEAQEGKVLLAKVNVDNVPGVANQLMVSSIPAVFAFWKREAVNSFVGNLPKPQLAQFVTDVLEHTGDSK